MRALLIALVSSFLLVVAAGCEIKRPRIDESVEFKQVSERVGLGNAVMLYEKQLTDDFWNGLNFEQWRSIFKCAARKSELEARALKGMIATSPGVAESMGIYAAVPVGSEFEDLAGKKALSQADCLEGWVVVFIGAREESDLEKTAVANISKTCKSFREWKLIYKLSPRGSALEEKAVAEMAKLAKTDFEWFTVFVIAPRNSDLETEAARHLGGSRRDKPRNVEKDDDDSPKKKGFAT